MCFHRYSNEYELFYAFLGEGVVNIIMEVMGRVVEFEKLTEGRGKDVKTLFFMNTLFSSHNPVPIKRNTVNLGQRQG